MPWRQPHALMALPASVVPHRPQGSSAEGVLVSLRQLVAETVLDESFADLYGVQIPEERRLSEPELRTASELVTYGHILDGTGRLAPAPRDDQRVAGHCRHASVLLCSVLLAHGYAARVRAGFAAYLDRPGAETAWNAHWLVEYQTDAGWVRVDAILDDIHRAALKIQFDPVAVPPTEFLSAAHVWRGIRTGDLEAATFRAGIWSGEATVASVAVRDLTALTGRVPLPWDVWGCMPPPTHSPDQDLVQLIDLVADHTLDPTSELVTWLAGHPQLEMPQVVLNGRTQQQVEATSTHARTALHKSLPEHTWSTVVDEGTPYPEETP